MTRDVRAVMFAERKRPQMTQMKAEAAGRSNLLPFWLTVVPFAVHWPELSGWLSSNPFYLTSGLGKTWKPDGFLAGLPGWIDGNAGVTLQALGRLVARDWMSGVIPWWNPYSGAGMPLAGEMQPAAFFLPFVLLLGTGPGLLALKIVMQIMAGLFTWRLLRLLGVSRIAAIVGGILFELNGTFAWASDTPTLPIAFLPLLLCGIEGALNRARERRPGGWVLIAVALAYSLAAGFPETAYIDGLLAFAWFGLRLYQAGLCRWTFAARVVGGGVAGLALAAPLLVAFASFLGQSGDARHVDHVALPQSLLLQFLLPYAYGPIFFGNRFDWYLLGGYAGVPVVTLAIAALAGQRRGERSLRCLLAVWVLLVLAKTVDLPGVTSLWNAVPFIRQTMVFRYACPSWELALIILACLALDDALSFTPGGRRRSLLSAGIAGLICVACLGAGAQIIRSLAVLPGGRAWFLVAFGYGVASLVCLAWALTRDVVRQRRAWLAGLLVADALLQFTVPILSGTRRDQKQVEGGAVSFLRAHLGLQRFYTLGPITPNYGAYFGLASINHNYVPQPEAWIDYIHSTLDPQAYSTAFNGTSPAPSPGIETRQQAFLRLMPGFAETAVKYVVAPASTLSADPQTASRSLKLVYADKLAEIFELPHAAPYFDAPAPCTLDGQSRLQVTAQCRVGGTLIRRELAFPGWSAEVNGSETAVGRDGIFQTVRLQGGSSTIRFRFSPPYERPAVLACLASFLAISLSLARRLQRPVEPGSWPSKVA